MDSAHISQLLHPFCGALPPAQLHQVSAYLDLLLRWNARINLTATRPPDQIISRHFGESLFTGRHLFPAAVQASASHRLLDLGAGAGFPGLPIKIYAPHIHLTLLESNQKKATFLREVARALALTNVDVFAGRAESFPTPTGPVTVTLRAVERFKDALPVAARLLPPQGRLALLIGLSQLDSALTTLPQFTWMTPIPIPQSTSRILMIGQL